MTDPADKLEPEEKQVASEAANNPNAPVDMEYIIARVKAVLTDPKGIWSEIKEEDLEPKAVYLKYLLVVAAIPQIASYIGMVVFGVSVPFTNMTFRWPIIGGLVTTVVYYAMALISVAVFALVIEKLGSTFGAKPTFARCLQLVGFSMTASYVGGILGIFPMLAMLGVLFGLYSLYTLYCGFQSMTEVPEESTLKYFAASVVVSIVAMFIIGMFTALLSPVSMDPTMAAVSTNDSTAAKLELPGGISIDMNKLEESVKELEKMAPPEDQ